MFESAPDITELGADVDLFFDLTGDVETRKALRGRVQETDSRHAALAPRGICQTTVNVLRRRDGPAGGCQRRVPNCAR